jgi:UDP-N-acetylglucosamine 2-epimerase (hydrolysing)
MTKKILFLTGTRADFGKLKSLIQKVEESNFFEAHIFVTGMHMLSKYGMTSVEVDKCNFEHTHKYINQNNSDSMDNILAKTIQGLSDYVKEIKPDMIVVHGDRVEAMGGAIVGALNNILVSHIEGGEVSGTIDELIRHSVSKLSHLHFVSNQIAKKRLMQLGEREISIYEIGSPDLDIMISKDLPTLDEVKRHYDITFREYGIFMYHPVTTELDLLHENIKNTVSALIESNKKFIVIYPNNDHGTDIIINEISRLKGHENFKIFPSIRFEAFLVILKNATCMIGNSSAGVREMPFYGIPSINVGNRQEGRAQSESITNVKEDTAEIISAIESITDKVYEVSREFGDGDSASKFMSEIENVTLWNTSKQKLFNDLV